VLINNNRRGKDSASIRIPSDGATFPLLARRRCRRV